MPRSRSALSLTEVLMTVMLLSVLSLVLVAVFTGSVSVFRLGSSRVDMHHRARETLRRIEDLAVTAIPPPPPAEAIYEPTAAAGPELQFFSGHEFFADEAAPYDPLTGDNLRLYSVLGLNGEVVLTRLQPLPQLSRVLARHIYSLEFERQGLGLVEARVHVRDSIRRTTGQTESLDYRLGSLIEVPYYGFR